MRTPALLALLSGLLYVFSFAPWDYAWLQWICFVPLLFAAEIVQKKSLRPLSSLFLLGMIPAVVICLGGFYWMIHATQQYGGLPLPAALVIFSLFCLTGQLQVPLFLLFRFQVSNLKIESKWPFSSAVLLGIAYVGIESLYPKLFLDTPGHAFYLSSWVRQSADIGGPFWITALILLINELLYRTLRDFKNQTWFRSALPAILLGAFIALYGVARNHQYEALHSRQEGRSELKVSLIQANIGDYLKVAAERGALDATDSVMNRYLGLSTRALAENQSDALIWPETAYPGIFQKPKTPLENHLETRLHGFLGSFSGTLVFGGYDSDASSLEYNSMFFYNSKSKTKDVYHKSTLLMFGETLPFAESFPEMKDWFPTMGFFGRGPGAEIKSVRNAAGDSFSFAPSICYEGLFTDHAIQGALLGADALLNITNDSWFGPHGEPYLHLALTQFRTIETRLPMIRSTNTGISIAIDAMGEPLSKTGVMTEALLHTRIGHRLMPESPYLKVARHLGPNWFVRLCQGILISVLLGLALTQRVRRGK